MREELISGQLNAVRELLPNDVIEDLCQEAGYFFRSRQLCPLVTIFHMIGAAISRERSPGDRPQARLFHKADQAFEILPFGVIDVDGVVRRMGSFGENLDIAAGVFSSGKDDFLK